jgi:hypothetical protein
MSGNNLFERSIGTGAVTAGTIILILTWLHSESSKDTTEDDIKDEGSIYGDNNDYR